jgi:hypothetical protein
MCTYKYLQLNKYPQIVVTTQVHVEQQPQVAQREVFPPSTSPSSCSPASSRRIDDVNDDDDLARENETIDRLLLEANADLVSPFYLQVKEGSIRNT